MSLRINNILLDSIQYCARLLYSAVVWVVAGVLYLKRAASAETTGASAQLWRQRLGRLPSVSGRGIWIHCASLGEINAISSLINALRKKYPERHFIISIMNEADVRTISQQYSDDTVVLFPFDCPRFVARALDRVHPAMVVVAEVEVWPNFLRACALRSIPVHLVNARLSQRALNRYSLLPAVFRRRILSGYCTVQVRDQADLDRFVKLGVDANIISVAGYLRWNYDPPARLLSSGRFLANSIHRPAWIAASTHPQDMKRVLGIHQYLRLHLRDVLLLLLPRYPDQNRIIVERDLRARGLNYAVIDEDWDADAEISHWLKAETSVLWIRRTGDSVRWYALADLALIGGGFDRLGGHNPIEAALAECAIFSGTRVENFTEIYQSLAGHQACVMHNDPVALGEFMLRAFNDEASRKTLCRNALTCVRSQRLEVDRIAGKMIEKSSH